MTSSNENAEDAPNNGPPPIIMAEAAAAAASAQEEDQEARRPSTSQHHQHHHRRDSEQENFPSLEDVPPPAYNGADYGQLDISQNGMDTGARVAEDGRVNIKINQRNRKLTNLLVPALRQQFDMHTKPQIEPPSLPVLDSSSGLPPPPMNVVIQIVGSRGDVQPFIALGQVLKNKYGHRVRIATHPTFRDFVTENGLEFFSIGGDPAELMAFMVKNPGLMPGIDSLKNGDVGKRRAGIYEMIVGCWRSCIEAGDGTGMEASDDLLDGRESFDSGIAVGSNPLLKPFVADAIIANPPSFAHMHIAEKLGIPLHLMFTMPWSPTQSFPHPLANIMSSNADSGVTNFISYALVDMLTWQGLGDVINKFRERSLGLEPVSIMWAPGMASRLRIPWTYCWSPALIPKPADWGNFIDISGFFFLNLASNYTPAPDLAEFLAAGPPPVYIGFGSIVVDDPNAMTKMIFEAVKKTGQRALVSKGWGGLGADEIGVPEGVFMLGNCPHDWLFKHVSCVVHHGGAGTTAAGITAGRPTVVVPFFGDQPFWGAMTARAGAGPFPVAYKDLNADKLADSIKEALKPASLERAAELARKVRSEDGTESGAQSFHKQLRLETVRCHLFPLRAAVWRVKRTDIRLSALAATVLGNEGLLDFSDLKLFRAREYETEDGPWDPISGGAAALIGTIGNLTMGIADFPVEVLKSLKIASTEVKNSQKLEKSSTTSPTDSTPISKSSQSSTSDLSLKQNQSRPSLKSEHASEESTASAETDATLQNTNAESAVENATPTASRTASTVLSPFDSNHRRWSKQGSRSNSPGPQPHRQSSSHAGDAIGHLTMEGAVGGARAIGRIASAGMKSPLDFTMGLAKGFHNAPKLYGDDTVRQSGKVTGFGSGLKEAAKEFHYGFFDGITGLATQPLAGAQKEGAAGFFKGAAKGIGGLILKPAAGIWGLPGYTFKGIYAEIQKHFGHSVQNYIIAARTAQGYEEWKESTPEQRMQIITAWKGVQVELRKAGRKYGKEREEEIHELATHTQSHRPPDVIAGFKNTRHLSWEDRKKLDAERQKLKRERKKENALARKNSEGPVKSRCKYCPFDHDEGLHRSQTFPSPQHPISTPGAVEAMDYEEAIKKSVTATSRGNPQEDAIIERALRASVRELQQAQENGEIENEAYQKAVAASVSEAKRARGELTAKDEKANPMESAGAADEEDEALTRALTQSLEDHKVSPQEPAPYENGHRHRHRDGEHDLSSDSGLGTDDDEDFKRTLEESKRLHTENQNKGSMASTKEVADNIEDDNDLKRAITESETAHKTREEDLARQKTEEEIVLEYVKKQSLLEEQHKQNLPDGKTA
jgi:UDP:flavonoid glycosyltransferase YjiC (YdhE family)